MRSRWPMTGRLDPVLFDELLRCRPWIEAALEHADGTHNWDDIVAGVYAGHFHFWPREKSAAITEINVYPRRRIFNVFLAGGDLADLQRFAVEVEESARKAGCDAVQCSGRAGWARALAGWAGKTPIYRRAVTEKGICDE